MAADDEDVAYFWDLVDQLRAEDPRIAEGTIMGGRCVRVDGEFLGLAASRWGGLVVKLPRERVATLIEQGVGQPFAPAGRVFSEWVAVDDPEHWPALLREGIAFVG